MIQRILLLNPFAYDGRSRNVGIDPVVSRHSGQEIKTGVTFPIGLAYMAAMLLKNGYAVRMLDPIAEKIDTDIIHAYADWSDAIIMPFSPSHADDTRQFRLRFREKLFVLGGGFSKFIPETLLEGDYCDVVLNGEPELTIVELMKKYPDIDDVRGIIYRKKTGEIQASLMPLVEDLDTLPFPERSLLNPRHYWDISFYGAPTAWVLPARGCPYNCIFCAQFDRNTKSVRQRSAKNVVDEIRSIVEHQGVRNIAFFDETFNVNDRQVKAISNEILARKLDIRWWCAARADLIKKDTIILMKEAGCIEMRIGLESANDSVLEYLRKDITVDKIRNGLAILRECGMNFSLQCIFGSPMEDRRTIAETMRFIRSAKPLFVSFNVLTPLPGSQLFEEIRNRVDLDTLKSFDILHTNFPLSRYSSAEMSRIIKKAYLSYYFSPGYLARMAREAIRQPRLIAFIVRTLVVQAWYVYTSIVRHGKK
jgi:radical SAM superfamily enzyme YgiQ (UPF0313 family)